MNSIIWLAAGIAAGGIACSVLDLNAARALSVAAIIGTTGSIFGGDALTSAFPALIGQAVILTPFAVLLASLGALACLKVVGVTYGQFRIYRLRHRTAQAAAPGELPEIG